MSGQMSAGKADSWRLEWLIDCKHRWFVKFGSTGHDGQGHGIVYCADCGGETNAPWSVKALTDAYSKGWPGPKGWVYE